MVAQESEKPPRRDSWLPLRTQGDVFGATTGHVATGPGYAAAIPTATALPLTARRRALAPELPHYPEDDPLSRSGRRALSLSITAAVSSERASSVSASRTDVPLPLSKR
jgi:hypothetical protein